MAGRTPVRDGGGGGEMQPAERPRIVSRSRRRRRSDGLAAVMSDAGGTRRQRLAVLPLSRPGVELGVANSRRTAALALLKGLDWELTGPRALYLDDAGLARAARSLSLARPDRLLVLQLGWSEPEATVRLARSVAVPVVLWGFVEHEPGAGSDRGSVRAVELAADLLHEAGLVCRCLFAALDAPDTARRLAALLAEPQPAITA